MSSSKQPDPPLYYTYTYTSTSKPNNGQQCLSIKTKRSSQFSAISDFTTKTSLQRINQLKPKQKILISNKNIVSRNKPEIDKESNAGTSDFSYDEPSINGLNLTESLSYDNIKPEFSLNKLSFFCGFEGVRLGEKGCLCDNPCKYRREWTKNNNKKDKELFLSILKQKPTKQNVIQIEKDLPRTHPQCPTFAKNATFRQMLRQVLTAYSIYDMELGYVQGINMIAGVLLYHIKSAEETFWAMVELMENQQLRMIYLNKLEHLKLHTSITIKMINLKINDLYNHMQDLDVMPQTFLSGWILSLMSKIIPMEHMAQVLERFRVKGWNYIYRLIVAYLVFCKEYLLMTGNQAQFLGNITLGATAELGGKWKQLVVAAEKIV